MSPAEPCAFTTSRQIKTINLLNLYYLSRLETKFEIILKELFILKSIYVKIWPISIS